MARRRPRTFSPELKADAARLRFVESIDAPVATIAQQLGIGKGTRERLHSTLHYQSPAAFEATWKAVV